LHELVADATALRGAWRLARYLHRCRARVRHERRGHAASITEHITAGERAIELPDISPYAAMIDHVLACLARDDDNRIEPASALPALELTLNVHQRLAQTAAAG
jgi:hypothetical protein